MTHARYGYVKKESTRPPVVYIDTPKKAKRAMKELLAATAAGNEVAVDTEFDPRPDGTIERVVLMSYSWGRGIRRVVHGDLIVKFFGAWLTNPKTKLVYQNFKADKDAFDFLGLDVLPSFFADVMVTGWLHDENLLKHGLKEQSLHFLKWARKAYDKIFCYVPIGKKNPVVMRPSTVMLDPPPDALRVMSHAAWIQAMLDYSGDDAESTICLHFDHRAYLEHIGYWQSYRKIDQPYTNTLLGCEDAGVVLDVPRLVTILRKVDATLMRAKRVFRQVSGKPDFNLNSNPQLQKLFFDEWQWPTREDLVTDSGAPSMDKEAMTWYAEEHGYEMARVKMEYTGARTLKGTFLVGLINGVSGDGRLRSDFNQIGADTGRISSRKRNEKEEYEVTLKSGIVRTKVRSKKVGANLQNIPARKEKDPYGIRGAFRAPLIGETTAWGDEAKEEHSLGVKDYSGFELCMAIHWSSGLVENSPMLKIMQKYGSPSACHAFTAINLYADRKHTCTPECHDPKKGHKFAKAVGVTTVLGKISMDDWKQVKAMFPDEYTVSKNNNFNLLYGGSPQMMARLRGLDYRDEDVLAECQQQADDWNDLYYEIGVYQRHMVNHGHKKGWVPVISGRRGHVKNVLAGLYADGRDPKDEYKSRKLRSYGERKCMNTPCQGSAADIVKVAMNLIANDEELRELRCKLLFPVHDELVTEFPTRHGPRVMERCIELMKKPFRNRMAFELDVEGKFAPNWLLAKG